MPNERSKQPGSVRVPPVHLLQERLDAVLAVVYLIFNEGYGGRDELAAEAIWLGRTLTELLPKAAEIHGLLAMMLLHDSRRDARFHAGELVLLDDQDQSRWDRDEIEDGRTELNRATRVRRPGILRTPSRVASLHAETPCDRGEISALYAELAQVTGSPVVELNRAIAVAETEGADAGLQIVDGLGLDDFRYLHSTRGELLRRLGRLDDALVAYGHGIHGRRHSNGLHLLRERAFDQRDVHDRRVRKRAVGFKLSDGMEIPAELAATI